MGTEKKVIEVAEKEVGYLEKRSNKDLQSKTKNAGSANWTKYGEWFGVNHVYWCAIFVSWCFHEAFGSAGQKVLCGSYSASCETIRGRFIDAGRYGQTPKEGCLIFFDGSRHAGANHIGIVRKVDGGTVYTIEGNTSGGSSVIDNGGGIAKKSYSRNYSRIMGYGYPKYPEEKKPAKPAISYYKRYDGNSQKIDTVLKAVGVPSAYRGSWKKRKALAQANGIAAYTGAFAQNIHLISLAKQGKLKKV